MELSRWQASKKTDIAKELEEKLKLLADMQNQEVVGVGSKIKRIDIEIASLLEKEDLKWR